jgi:hypothetical protein
MNDLVAHVDRGAVTLKRALYNVDGALNPGTKAARLCEDDPQAIGLKSHDVLYSNYTSIVMFY